MTWIGRKVKVWEFDARTQRSFVNKGTCLAETDITILIHNEIKNIDQEFSKALVRVEDWDGY